MRIVDATEVLGGHARAVVNIADWGRFDEHVQYSAGVAEVGVRVVETLGMEGSDAPCLVAQDIGVWAGTEVVAARAVGFLAELEANSSLPGDLSYV